MTLLFVNNGTGGTSGATPTTSDTGSGSSWTGVSILAPGTLTYDGTHTAHTPGGYTVVTTTATPVYLEAGGFTAGTVIGARCYTYRIANPGVNQTLMRLMTGAGSEAARVTITAGGKVSLQDSAATVLATTTTSLTLSAQMRIEALVNTTSGAWTVQFSAADTSTPVETLSGTGGNFLATTIAAVRFGNCNANNSGQTWLDDMAVADSLPGPWTSGEVAAGGGGGGGTTTTAAAAADFVMISGSWVSVTPAGL